MKKRGAKIKHIDPLLKTEPWRVALVFSPIESVLSRLEIDGTITTTANGDAIFVEESSGDWYDTAEALRGIIEFHRIASERRGEVAHVSGLARLAELIATGDDISEDDVTKARNDIALCKRQAYLMRRSEAVSVLKVVSIGAQFDLQSLTYSKEAA